MKKISEEIALEEIEKIKKPWHEQWWFITLVLVVGLAYNIMIITSGGLSGLMNMKPPNSIFSSIRYFSYFNKETSQIEYIRCINAKTLYQEYKANTAKADLKYKDKIYIIYGIIGSIEKDISDTKCIIIDNDGEISLKSGTEEFDYTYYKVGSRTFVKGKIIGFKTHIEIWDYELEPEFHFSDSQSCITVVLPGI
ncbi:MAG: hypothetical protein PHD83_01080 [Caldisericia bacterium]|nr:hypothetical protein [Caldisericia bacterium]